MNEAKGKRKQKEIAKKIDRQSLESHAKINYKFLKKLID